MLPKKSIIQTFLDLRPIIMSNFITKSFQRLYIEVLMIFFQILFLKNSLVLLNDDLLIKVLYLPRRLLLIQGGEVMSQPKNQESQRHLLRQALE